MEISRTLGTLSVLSTSPANSETVTELFQEYVRMKLCQEVLPCMWGTVTEQEDPEICLEQLCSAIGQLKASWKELMFNTPALQAATIAQQRHLLGVLHSSLSITQPATLFTSVLCVCLHSVKVWKKRCSDSDVSMDTEETAGDYWAQFMLLVSLLRELGTLTFFLKHSVVEVVRREVCCVVEEQCSGEFEEPIIEELVLTVGKSLTNWIAQIYGGEEDTTQWLSQTEYLVYKSFAELRISELFDILVDYPDSEAALRDLRTSLSKVNLRSSLISNLKQFFEQRLLHPGANTADIITQYVSAIKGLRLLDPSGVVLEQVCEPVRSYLQTREDTVRTIVASLIDDSEIADELVEGEPVLVNLDDESDGEDKDYDSWEPDPIDADPTKTSKSRQSSDIISLLVNIYGSREMFVNEYRNLLADRLLQNTGYDTSREVRNLELLKLRFGESYLHFCEVMIKDIADSKRISTYIHTKLHQEEKTDEVLEVDALILSHVFWPNFREEKLKLPEFVQRQLDKYCELYKGLKGMRTLNWKPHLGLVEVDLQLEDRELSLCVTPFRAAIIHLFGEKSKWTVDGLSTVLEAQPSAVRRHLGFWVSQGVLKEKPTDTFAVIERQQKGKATSSQEVEDDDESATVSAEDQREMEFQVFWAYINGMLKSLGKMNLDRIHSTLRMFAMQGESGKECSLGELKLFLESKVKQQQLCVSEGLYHLP